MTLIPDILTEDRRLVILRFLSDIGGQSNSSVLQDALAAIGHRTSRDRVETDLSWLAEQGLVVTEDLGKGLVLVTLSQRGGDVATGVATCPGVKRPRISG